MALPVGAAQPLPSDNRFERLIASVTDYAIFMVDAEGTVTSWNAGAAQIIGYDPVEIVGQHFSRFFTAEDRQSGLPARILDAARREGRHEDEGWRVRKDGGRFWANVVTQPVADEHGAVTGFVKIVRDVTARRAAQEALRQSERRFRILVDG